MKDIRNQLYLSADSGASARTSAASSEGGRLSWKGVLKKCCCSLLRCFDNDSSLWPHTWLKHGTPPKLSGAIAF